MKSWRSTRARRVFAALRRLGWRVERERGSHKVLRREGWPDFVWAFHDGEEIGPRMLAYGDAAGAFASRGASAG